LPFGTSSINYDTSGNVIGKLPSTAQMAIQYYKGVMLALDSLSRSGYKITSNIYDTNGDTLVLQSIIDKAEMPDMDLIIGPFFIDELRKASRFCERFKIPLISPYSTTTSFIKSNPYYILSKPTLSSHCKALYDYMEMKFNPSRIIMLYTNTDQDKNYAALFEQAWKQSALKPSLYKLTDSTKVTYRQVDLYLMPGENNIIIIPSTNETFISKMTAKLDSLSATYNITLIGMPQWRESQTLKVNQLSRLNCIISHYSLLNKSNDAYKKLAVTYANRYNAAITDYAIDGYNDAFYFIKTLSDKRFTAEYNFPQLDMICKQMILVPQSKLSNTIAATADYYENKFVKILQYKNGRLEELP
jgi:ABC-type branched-subunit amino acid transport system substrate-binding protein